jgi:hypothetical protein
MKFHFENLGAIDKADVELWPLTIICGRNNTGKTYISYAIHALLGNWRQLVDWQVPEADMTKLLNDATVSINLGVEFVEKWQGIQTRTSDRWKKFLPDALAAKADRFQSLNLSFDLLLDNKWRDQPFKKEIRSEEGRVLFSAEKAANSDVLEFLAVKDNDHPDLPRFALEEFVMEAVMETVLTPYVPVVFMVSTERTGAVTFKEELNLNKNKLVNLLAKMGQGKDALHPGELFKAIYKQGGYPLPVERNVNFVNNFASLEQMKAPLLVQHPEITSDFEAVVGGSYQTSKEGVTHFAPRGSTAKLQLNEASSAVRSLVVFWYWLKARAEAGQLLLIDEPELNLHPENQRAYARLLAKLVRLGVRVLITTHSDTMIREFNTLLMLSRNLPHMPAIRTQYGYADNEFLNPDDVRLYVASGKEKTSTGRNKKGTKSTLECITPNPQFGLAAEVFDHSILEMAAIQDALRYGAV